MHAHTHTYTHIHKSKHIHTHAHTHTHTHTHTHSPLYRELSIGCNRTSAQFTLGQATVGLPAQQREAPVCLYWEQSQGWWQLAWCNQTQIHSVNRQGLASLHWGLFPVIAS